MALAQKLGPEVPLSAAWQARVGHVWLAVNGQPDSLTYTTDSGPLLAVDDVPDLPGYVTVSTPTYQQQVVNPAKSDDRGFMFLQIPGTGSRDLEDAVVTRHGTEEWVQFGATLYRPRATLPALASGANTVTFGAEGYAEWRLLAAAGTATIAAEVLPAGAAAGDPPSWRLYGPDMEVLDAGSTFPATVSVPKPGCSLLLFGPAGASVTVTVAPAA